MNQMRHVGVEPVQAMGGMGDHPTGIALYGSIVTALLRRELTGRGGKAHTSLLANGLWSASCYAQAAWADADFSQMPPQRLTTAVYEAADGRWIQFSMVRNVEEFDRIVMLLGHVEWLADERFSTPEARLENYAELTALLREVIAERTAHEWVSLFRDNDINVALVAEFEDLPDDPQVLANGMAPDADPSMPMSRVIRDPINVEGAGRVGPLAAPEPGEHADEILGELGYDAKRIAQLRASGVI
jgi:formyl-CoA transferase